MRIGYRAVISGIMGRMLAFAAFAAALSAGFMMSCAKADRPVAGEEKRVEITPGIALHTTSVTADFLTRVPVDGLGDLTLWFARADETTAGTYGNYASTAVKAIRNGGNGGQGVTFDPVQYYTENGLKSKLTGWYPEGESFTGGSVTWKIDGSQDVMTATRQEGSKAAAMPDLTFDHRLSQIQFYPYAETKRISDGWGKIVSIEVLGQRNEVVYTLTDDAGGTVAFTGSETNEFSAGIPDTGMAITVAAASEKETVAVMAGNAVMIAPQSSADYELKLRITTGKQGVKTVSLKRKFDAGSSYRIYLRFTQLEMIITPEVTIGDWVAGYDSSVKTDPVTDPKVDIEDWGTGSDNSVEY